MNKYLDLYSVINKKGYYPILFLFVFFSFCFLIIFYLFLLYFLHAVMKSIFTPSSW